MFLSGAALGDLTSRVAELHRSQELPRRAGADVDAHVEHAIDSSAVVLGLRTGDNGRIARNDGSGLES